MMRIDKGYMYVNCDYRTYRFILVVKVFSNYIIEHYAVTPCNHWGVFREVLLYAQFVSLFYTFRGIYYLK